MGFTLAAVEGASFGIGSDDDGIEDPELEAAPLDEMTFFLQLLAPLQPAAVEEKGTAHLLEDRPALLLHSRRLQGSEELEEEGHLVQRRRWHRGSGARRRWTR